MGKRKSVSSSLSSSSSDQEKKVKQTKPTETAIQQIERIAQKEAKNHQQYETTIMVPISSVIRLLLYEILQELPTELIALIQEYASWELGEHCLNPKCVDKTLVCFLRLDYDLMRIRWKCYQCQHQHWRCPCLECAYTQKQTGNILSLHSNGWEINQQRCSTHICFRGHCGYCFSLASFQRDYRRIFI